MSRILKDKEMRYFLDELQHTPAGVRYRKAWDASQQALKAVLKINGDDAASEFARNAVRRLYIARQEQASLALGVLVNLYHWPKKAQADVTFTYQPPAATSLPPRISRKPV